MAAKTKKKSKSSVSREEFLAVMNRLADNHSASNAQLINEMHHVRQELQDMKSTLGRLKPQRPSTPRGGGFLFGRRRQIPVQVEPEKPKPAFSVEDLIPLLPHLKGAFPQLKNPKVADSIKVLSNPAVLSMIQQFLANGGLNMLKGKQVQQVSERERRGIFRL